ncbi:MAG TPA: hemerythrin domain-containing protein [Candidatus Nanoarchaeia archaeon]|nr:hemerythrin domain-containing protein [Candidatus Nanoarchaeia archaeon]
MKTISSLMQNEHDKIIAFLFKFEKSFENDRKLSGEIFKGLKNELLAHFTLEEVAIFNMYGNMKGEEVEYVFDLLEEHGEIKNIMDRIGMNLSSGDNADFSALKERLLRHANFERLTFYPMLDRQINNEQRQLIVGKIMEIKNLN